MSSNTLYYLLSTMPQVISAAAAIAATLTFLRIREVRGYLVGDGQAALNRWESYSFITSPEKEFLSGRLIDAVARQSIPEIGSNLQAMYDLQRSNLSPIGHPTGFQYTYEERFCSAAKYIDQLKQRTAFAICAAGVSVLFCIFCLAFVDVISKGGYSYLIVLVNIAIFLIALGSTVLLILFGFFRQVSHEKPVPRNRPELFSSLPSPHEMGDTDRRSDRSFAICKPSSLVDSDKVHTLFVIDKTSYGNPAANEQYARGYARNYIRQYGCDPSVFKIIYVRFLRLIPKRSGLK
ncbi:MAG: hypothetical protein FWD65_07010 [Coriobacteriia bacterium]|nr:hypothetical protein [Coriobacteriia bacterium]